MPDFLWAAGSNLVRMQEGQRMDCAIAVIGGGAAGLMAAVSAAEELEKHGKKRK